MRTTKGLFTRLIDPMTLVRAARDSARGKRRRADVAWFLFRLESEALRIASALRDGRWRPVGFFPRGIRDPKPRVIAWAPFADRVVHLAVARLMEPTIVRSRVDGVFACLPGLGTHRAVLRLAEHQRRYRFALHLDVRAYFPSVDPERMQALLRRRIRDDAFLDVLDRIFEAGRGFYADPEVRAYARLEPHWPPPCGGLPIGAATSQLLAAHLYLDGLDHHIKRELKIPGYVRYVDDMFLFSDSRAQLRQARAAIGEWLERERGLRLKHPDARILSGHGTLHGLGHAIRRTGIEALPRARVRFRRRVRQAWRDRRADPRAFRRSAAASAGVILFGVPWTCPRAGARRAGPDRLPGDPVLAEGAARGAAEGRAPVWAGDSGCRGG